MEFHDFYYVLKFNVLCTSTYFWIFFGTDHFTGFFKQKCKVGNFIFSAYVHNRTYLAYNLGTNHRTGLIFGMYILLLSIHNMLISNITWYFLFKLQTLPKSLNCTSITVELPICISCGAITQTVYGGRLLPAMSPIYRQWWTFNNKMRDT